jgi:NAD(P)-dependent dehydrogenase (short-subunit alcohol dehydrogenase family)
MSIAGSNLPPLPIDDSTGGRKWFVTGASRGLGRQVVIAALKAGETVYATARNASQLDDLVKQYPRLRTGSLDVCDASAASKAIADANERMGGLDVVVNNAGYANVASVEDVDLDDFKTQVETNFFGTLYVTKAAIPILRKRGGHIMQIASIGARVGSPGLAAYQSAKWAVTGFTTVLSSELKPLGIHCTILQPGGMRTDWSGSSMTCAPVSAPYEATVGNKVKMLGEYNGNEPTDPVKVGEVCVRLSRHPDPPLELLIGSDAVHFALLAGQKRQNTDELWRQVSESVGYD